jgi:hypothetical protein
VWRNDSSTNNTKLYEMREYKMRESKNEAIVVSFLYLGKPNTDFMKRFFTYLLFIIIISIIIMIFAVLE